MRDRRDMGIFEVVTIWGEGRTGRSEFALHAMAKLQLAVDHP